MISIYRCSRDIAYKLYDSVIRNYKETDKTIDFWLVRQPAFLQSEELAALAQIIPQPAAAVVSTDPKFITFLKLRLEFVVTGHFEASTDDALKSIQS